MRLTSSVKELGAILQKLINLDKIQNENETNDGLLAMRIDSFNSSERLETFGSVRMKARNGNNFVLSRTERKPFYTPLVNKMVHFCQFFVKSRLTL